MERHALPAACLLILLKVGVIIPINRAMIAITTNSSMSVKPHLLFITASLVQS